MNLKHLFESSYAASAAGIARVTCGETARSPESISTYLASVDGKKAMGTWSTADNWSAGKMIEGVSR